LVFRLSEIGANSNGIVEVDELRDQRSWGTLASKGAGGNHAANIATPDTIDWTNGVPITSGGLPYGGMAIVLQPVTNMYDTYVTNEVDQSVTTNTVKECWPETVKITGAAVKSNCAGGPVLLRRSPDHGEMVRSGRCAAGQRRR